MAQLLLLHHALGVTSALRRLADRFEDAGHDVVVPDLFESRVFASVEEGMEHVESVGIETLAGLGEDAASDMQPGFVVCGISLGAIAAMRAGVSNDAVAAVVVASACIPEEYIGGPWPRTLPLRVVASREDAMFRDEGDLEAATEYTHSAQQAKLKLMPGREHLFVEADDPESTAATEWLVETVMRFLDRVDADQPPVDESSTREREAWDLP